MGTDTEMFKAERSAGVLMYRLFIVIALTAITALGGWNLKATHDSSVLIEGLTQRVKDRDEEMNRIEISVLELTKAVAALREEHAKDRDAGMNRDARLETRVSVIEAERREEKKP